MEIKEEGHVCNEDTRELTIQAIKKEASHVLDVEK